MSRKEGQRRAFDSSSNGSLGFAHTGGLFPEGDGRAADCLPGDVVEDATANWENAWIDLGGEG